MGMENPEANTAHNYCMCLSVLVSPPPPSIFLCAQIKLTFPCASQEKNLLLSIVFFSPPTSDPLLLPKKAKERKEGKLQSLTYHVSLFSPRFYIICLSNDQRLNCTNCHITIVTFFVCVYKTTIFVLTFGCRSIRPTSQTKRNGIIIAPSGTIP